METVYVVQGFKAGKRGTVEPLPPQAYKSEDEARRQAARMGLDCLGVIAFAQTADVEAGDYDDPIELTRHGMVPELQ
jgi:hypothetical protein